MRHLRRLAVSLTLLAPFLPLTVTFLVATSFLPLTRPTVTVTVAASESVKRSVAVCLRLIFDFASLTLESLGAVLSLEPLPAAAVIVKFFVAALVQL